MQFARGVSFHGWSASPWVRQASFGPGHKSLMDRPVPSAYPLQSAHSLQICMATQLTPPVPWFLPLAINCRWWRVNENHSLSMTWLILATTSRRSQLPLRASLNVLDPSARSAPAVYSWQTDRLVDGYGFNTIRNEHCHTDRVRYNFTQSGYVWYLSVRAHSIPYNIYLYFTLDKLAISALHPTSPLT